MDDLISRQAALNCFHDWIDRHGDVHTADEMQEYNAIEALPSAQLDIIHCKDCKHGELFSDQYLCHKDMLWREGDFYCKGAERREGCW